MPVRRLSLVCLLVAAIGCTPAVEKQQLLTLSVASTDRTLAPGGTASINVFARTVAGDTTTPAANQQVTLAVADGLGTLASPTVTLDAAGHQTVTFTMCTADNPKCLPETRVAVTGTMTLDGTALTSSTAFSVKAGESATCADDGAADCTKTECLAKACKLGGDTGKCSAAKTCETGTVGNTEYDLSVTLYTPAGDERTVMRAPVGGSPFKVKAKVAKKDGSAVAGVDVKFEASDAKLGGFAATEADAAVTSLTVKSDPTGSALVFFKPGSETGTGRLTVSALDLAKPTTFSIVKAGTLVFAPKQTDPYYRVMGVQTSGYREQNLLRFALLDGDGQPYTGQANVTFKTVSTGGVSLFPSAAPINENGEVTVTLYSGTQASTVAVTATATIGTTQVTTTSDTIAIVGAKPSGTNLAVNCEKRAVPSLQGNDCAFQRLDYQTVCTAVLGDRFNNKVGRDTRVSWSTEAALFGPPSSTPLANPDEGPEAQRDLGVSKNVLSTLNTPLPRDVDPVAGEQNQQLPGNTLCPARDGGPRTFNPRDGLDTFIVHTQGEEGFVDANENGQWDSGEEFFDLGEPYVDANDNNKWDAMSGTQAEEYYVDLNHNGKYDGPNGVWDSDTTIWAQGHIAFTAAGTGQIIWNPDPLPRPVAGGGVGFNIRWEDVNMNEPAPTFTTYAMKLFAGPGSVQQSSPDHWADSFGSMAITQVPLCNSQRICHYETRIAFDRAPRQSGLYTAPTSPPFSPAVIQATATTDTLTVTDSRTVPAALAPPP